jgi:hypothetical protein
LAELVAAIDPSAQPGGKSIVLPLGGREYAAVQYDAVDADTWPYMITVDSRGEDIAPVRAQSTRIFKRLQGRGWELQLTSAADDDLRRRSPAATAV